MQPKQKFTTEQFVEIYNCGLNDRQIAEKLKVSISLIRKTRYKNNLMPKNPHNNSNPKITYQKIKEANKRYFKKINQKPERKAAKKADAQTPRRKALLKIYNSQPEIKAKRKIYNAKRRKKHHQIINKS